MRAESMVNTEISAEIGIEVLHRSSVEGARPRSFTIGPRFEQTLLALPDRRRRKTIRILADVVVGAPGPLSARSDHPFRVAAASTAPPLVGFDGAVARRCYVERNVASALRLHYWVMSGGALEFAAAGNHDEMDAPA